MSRDSEKIAGWMQHPLAKQIFKLSLAGVASGLPADLLTFPWYRIATILHTQGANPYGVQYKGVLDAFSGVYRQEGVRGLFKGMPVVLVGNMPGMVLLFTGIELTKLATGSEALAGYGGQGLASLVFVPSTVLSEIQQSRGFNPELQNMKLKDLVFNRIKVDGPFALYRGFWPQFFTFGTCHAVGLSLAGKIRSTQPEMKDSLGWQLFSNTAGYVTASVATNPLEVVKKRLQVGDTNRDLFPERNAVQAAIGIYQREGIGAFFKGAAARVGFPGVRMGISLTIFGQAYKAISDMMNPEVDMGPKVGR